jgi:molecular chaperone HtpG
LDNKYLTLPECLPKPEEEEKDENVVESDTPENTNNEEEKDDRTIVYYVTDTVQQSQYINMFREQGMNAFILDQNIDTAFISQLESRNEKYRFLRIDADLTDSLKDNASEDDTKAYEQAAASLTERFREALGNDKLTVTVEPLKNSNVSSILTLSEENRRMNDMLKMYSSYGGQDPSFFQSEETLTLNANNELVKYILAHEDGENVKMFCEQLYDLAAISNRPLSPDAMTKFVNRSNEIMMLLAK